MIPGGIISEDATSGTAHWGFIAQYLTVNLTPRLSSITRFEVFQDFEGQRTGFEGLYTALTAGLSFKPYKSVIFRPELRYDYNAESRPFEGRRSCALTASNSPAWSACRMFPRASWAARTWMNRPRNCRRQ